jgi:hypothetical protein
MNPSSVCFVLNLANIFLTVIMVLIAFKIIPIKEGRQKDAIMVLLSFSVILSYKSCCKKASGIGFSF